MKVQIVYLDPHDDQVSARDKLAWAQAPRVLLVWPAEGRILTRQLDLVLLQRQARRQGAQLGMVCRDPLVIEGAAELGIPVFASVDSQAESSWRRVRRPHELPRRTRAATPPAPPLARPTVRARWLRWPAFGLACLALLATLVVALPSTDVTVSPVTRGQQVEGHIRLDPSVGNPQSDGRIPSRQATVSVSGELRVPATGTVMVAAHAAGGTVQFTNLTAEPVSIPAGTGVLPLGHPEQRFLTSQSVILEGVLGSATLVSVAAQNPGVTGNLPAGSLNAIDGDLGLKAAVTNPTPTSGGTDEPRSAASAQDRATLLQQLSAQLLGEASTRMSADLSAGEAVAPSSLSIVRITEETYDHPAGEAADTVSLKIQMDVGGLVYRPKEVLLSAKEVLQSRVPAGYLIVPGSQSIEILNPSPAGAESASIPFRATEALYMPFDAKLIRQAIRGRSVQEAEQALRVRFPGGAPPAIRNTPGWLPWVSWLDVRISVRTPWDAG